LEDKVESPATNAVELPLTIEPTLLDGTPAPGGLVVHDPLLAEDREKGRQ
jgi:hypothetical protein